MFGYIKPNIPELRVREKTRYDAWYCGLCRRLGDRYGIISRACLSYDCAFLALLLSSVNENHPVREELHSCTFKPLGRKRVMIAGDSPALDYAAAICVLLAKYKLDDEVQDGKPLFAAAKLPFAAAFSKAKKDLPDAEKVISEGLEELSMIENEGIASPDVPANSFGKLLKKLLLLSPAPEKSLPVLGEIGFWLGRYIYLLDAWDDRQSDEKKGLYNPFVLSKSDKELAELLINISINSAISAYNLLDIHSECDLASNIICEGCFAVTNKIFNNNSLNSKI